MQRRLLILIFLSTCLCMRAISQSPATSTIVPPVSSLQGCPEAAAIEFRGLRLGMTSREVIRRLGLRASDVKEQIFEKEDSAGEPVQVDAGTAKLEYNITPENRLPGIVYMRLRFYRDKLFSLLIAYDGTIQWKNVEEFAAAVSKPFNLPRENWLKATGTGEYEGLSAMKYVFCDKLHLAVTYQAVEPQPWMTYSPDYTRDGFRKSPLTGEPIRLATGTLLEDKALADAISAYATALGEKEKARRKAVRESTMDNKKRVFKP